MQEHLVICDNLIKIYKADELETVALQGLDLDVMRGEVIAIVGASGSGKSTLLNILGGLDLPSAGRVQVAGHDLTRLKDEERARYRGSIIGHVWQQSGRNLFTDLTVEENINLPQILAGTGAKHYRRRTQELLEIIGLPTYGKRKPAQLSGGQQQRVAIAVALANQPALLLADEPTGELDIATTQEMMAFFQSVNRQFGVTIIIVTHDVMVASQVDRTIAIRDGRTSTETIRRSQPGQALPQQTGYPQGAQLSFPLNGPHYQTSPMGGTSAVIGLPEETHQEAIYIDRVGLLQLPALALEQVPLRGHVEVRIAFNHVELWPAGSDNTSYQNLAGSGSSAVIGLPLNTHREAVLVDRAGRLQLPQEVLSQVPFHGRAYVRVARSHIQLWAEPSTDTDIPGWTNQPTGQ